MICDIENMCVPSLCCGPPCASSGFLLDQKISHILNKSEPCLCCRCASVLAFCFGLSWYVTLSAVVFLKLKDLFLSFETAQTRYDFCSKTNATFTFQSLMQLLLFKVFFYWSFYCKWIFAFYDIRKWAQWYKTKFCQRHNRPKGLVPPYYCQHVSQHQHQQH